MKRTKNRIDKEKYPATIKSMEFRSGDQMIDVAVETRTAVIDFADILEATTVEPDDDCDAPWESCDGYEHTFTRTSSLNHSTALMDSAGWVSRNRGESGLITVDTDVVKKQWMGEYSPFSGESRQTYEERIAETKKEAVERLVKWYENGWQAWGVVCEFLGEDDSIWGIYADDDDDSYLQDTREEIALQVVFALEKRGYTVINQPKREPYDAKKDRRKRMLHDIARHMGFKEVEAYKEWLRAPSRERRHNAEAQKANKLPGSQAPQDPA